jgi:hypothetical protein
MCEVLDTLEWLAKYGFVDIIFGVGILGFLSRRLREIIPSNYDHLHVNVTPGGRVGISVGMIDHSLQIQLRNSGQSNCYVARAHFRPKLRQRRGLWLKPTPTRVMVHPVSDRITDKDAFELKFLGRESIFNDYETLIRPGHSAVQVTWLAVVEPVQQEDINNRCCGKLYIEYAVSGKQGLHVERI